MSLFMMLICLLARRAGGQVAPDVPRSCSAAIDGHVVDLLTHEPVAGAVVRIAGGVVVHGDTAGRFTVASLCPGKIRFEIEHAGYDVARLSVQVAGPTSVEVELIPAGGGETIVIKERAPPPMEMRSAAVISGETLERARGKAFTQALAEVPGVSELTSATGLAKPIVRGQFGRRLLMLVDGIRHRAQEWGLDHAPEIDPFIADSITVIRGAGGVRYGPDAMGGVILVTPPELRFRPGYEGEAHLIGAWNGRGGTVAGRVLGALARMPGLAFQLEGSVKRLAAPETPDYPLDNAGAFDWGAGSTLGYRHGELEVQLSYRRYQAELGVCTCLRISSSDEFFAQLQHGMPIGSELYSSELAIDRPRQTVVHDQAAARARWDLPNLGTATATYSFQHDLRREYDVARTDTTAAQFNFRLMTHELEGVLAHRPIHLSEHVHLRGAAGIVAMAQFHRYHGLTLVPSHTAYGAAVFASERLIGHDLEVEAGVRYDLLSRTASIERRDFLRLVRSGQLAMDACGPGEATPVECASTFHALTATVGGLYRITEELSAKVELSTASRAPNPDEQYLNGASPTFPVLGLGKPDLGPETTYSSSATLDLRHARITAEASAYVNLIHDYIYFAPALDGDGNPIFDVLIRGSFPRFATRPVDALFYGADGGFAVRPHPMLELGAQASLVRAENTADGSPLVFVPPDRVRGELTVTLPDVWAFRKTVASLNGTYVTRQTRFDLAADLAAPPKAYLELGGEVGTQFRAGDQIVKLALQGKNLTSARHRDYTSLLRYFADEPSLQVWLRMSVFFDSTRGLP